MPFTNVTGMLQYNNTMFGVISGVYDLTLWERGEKKCLVIPRELKYTVLNIGRFIFFEQIYIVSYHNLLSHHITKII